MKYNRPQATASWGTMAKDWEKGIDYQRLYHYRFRGIDQGARQAVWNEIARQVYSWMGSPHTTSIRLAPCSIIRAHSWGWRSR